MADDKPSLLARILQGLPGASMNANEAGAEAAVPLVQSFIDAAKIPGQVYSGEIPMRDSEGKLSQQGVDAGVDLAYNIGGIGSAVPRPAGSVGIFGGRRGGQDLAARIQAQEMERAGNTPSRIWQDTGYGRGAGDELKFEIPTGNAMVGNGLSDIARGKNVPLSQFYDHPPLYNSYPSLADIPVHNNVNPGAMGTSYGDSIGLAIGSKGEGLNGLNTSRAKLKPVMEHEIQHLIQEQEGWPRGGSATEFIPPPEKLQKLWGLRRELDDALLLKQIAGGEGHNDLQRVFNGMKDKVSPRSIEWAPLDEDILRKRVTDINEALTDPGCRCLQDVRATGG
jgi:hypothetical protein